MDQTWYDSDTTGPIADLYRSDILPLILAHCDTPSLCRLLRTSKYLSAIASRILFHHVVLNPIHPSHLYPLYLTPETCDAPLGSSKSFAIGNTRIVEIPYHGRNCIALPPDTALTQAHTLRLRPIHYESKLVLCSLAELVATPFVPCIAKLPIHPKMLVIDHIRTLACHRIMNGRQALRR
jgi:hypothetical protein